MLPAPQTDRSKGTAGKSGNADRFDIHDGACRSFQGVEAGLAGRDALIHMACLLRRLFVQLFDKIAIDFFQLFAFFFSLEKVGFRSIDCLISDLVHF
jgi:hypothetical protein